MSVYPSLRKRIGLKLFSELYRELVAEHKLTTLFWECTLRCNLSCRHCGSDCRVAPELEDMPLEDFLKVLDEEITPNINPKELLIILSGGEVLLREDLERAGSELAKRGYMWGMVTNGMALTTSRLDSLLASGLSSISVSLDGFPDTHNHIRQHPLSYERAISAIRNIVRRPQLTYDVITCVTSHLIPRLEEFKDMLIREGVTHWRIATIFPSGRAKEDSSLKLTNSEFREVLDFIKATRKEGKIDVSYSCEGFLGNYESEVRDEFYQCAAGVNVASIRVDGSISGCTSIRSNFHQGNIYHDHFWDVWQNRFQPYRDRVWARKEQCAECKMFDYCQGGGMHLYDDDSHLARCHYIQLCEE